MLKIRKIIKTFESKRISRKPKAGMSRKRINNKEYLKGVIYLPREYIGKLAKVIIYQRKKK